MSVTPIQLERLDSSQLLIHWSDDRRQIIPLRRLRDHCPCATCRQEKEAPPESENSLRVLSPAETLPLEIVQMSPVGNYAYNIQFSDGHQTGIFTFELLRSLDAKSDGA